MNALAGVGLDRRALVRAALGLVGIAVVLFLALRLTSDWRALPAEALSAFHLDLGPLALAWGIQTLGWLLVVDTWRQVLVRGGGAVAAETAEGVAAETAEGVVDRPPAVGAKNLSPLHPAQPSENPRTFPSSDRDLPRDPVSFARHLQLYAYTSLTQVLPGSFWHPISRIAVYRPFGVSALAVSAAVVIEWMLLGVAGLLLYGLAAPFARATPPGWVPLLAGLALLALVLLHPAVFARLMRRAARWLGQDLAPPALAGRDVARWLAREVGVLACSGVALYLVMRAISPAASLADALGVAGLSVAIASLLAWLPATALIKDGSMVVLLTPVYRGAGADTGTAALVALGVTLAWRIWSVGVQLSWAALASLWAGRLPGGKPDEA